LRDGEGWLAEVQGLQHVLYERDDDVVYVLVGQTMSELDVANPIERV